MAELMMRDAVLMYDASCQCGAYVPAGSTVKLWAKYGVWDEQLECIGCPSCTKPDTLFDAEDWILKRRGTLKLKNFGAMYGSGSAGLPAPHYAEWLATESSLEEIRRQQWKVLVELYKKLPKCHDCGVTATHHVGVEFLCAQMAQEHPQAVEVPWAKEIALLGSRG